MSLVIVMTTKKGFALRIQKCDKSKMYNSIV